MIIPAITITEDSPKKSILVRDIWIEIWWKAPMEGSVLSFLKAEWKVSDTDSAHWASSLKKIDASYQVSAQLAKQFQERRFLEIDQAETRIAYGSHVC
jgi:hypothetical protein